MGHCRRSGHHTTHDGLTGEVDRFGHEVVATCFDELFLAVSSRVSRDKDNLRVWCGDTLSVFRYCLVEPALKNLCDFDAVEIRAHQLDVHKDEVEGLRCEQSKGLLRGFRSR